MRHQTNEAALQAQAALESQKRAIAEQDEAARAVEASDS